MQSDILETSFFDFTIHIGFIFILNCTVFSVFRISKGLNLVLVVRDARSRLQSSSSNYLSVHIDSKDRRLLTHSFIKQIIFDTYYVLNTVLDPGIYRNEW